MIPAKSTARKKIIAKTLPNGISRITAGIVMNKSPGPEFGAMPKENTAGMITRPASNAAAVSKKAIWWMEDYNLSLKFLYELFFEKQQSAS